MTYWVLPLFNFMPGWRNVSPEPRSRTSQIARLAGVPAGSDSASGWSLGPQTDRPHLMPFRLDGRTAVIEPLPDYEESRRRLREGEERRLITAVAVGEVRGEVVEIVTGQEAREHIDQLSQKYHGQDYDPEDIKTERVTLWIVPNRQTVTGPGEQEGGPSSW